MPGAGLGKWKNDPCPPADCRDGPDDQRRNLLESRLGKRYGKTHQKRQK
jgi:hypothetical protein